MIGDWVALRAEDVDALLGMFGKQRAVVDIKVMVLQAFLVVGGAQSPATDLNS